ncbi:LacI family DNA-binding transcriptional regulator [Zunongwangia sp.]|uniref:LacI family DNA-binding transcriptional regulator n=1 Tax=Zunongwangia sp. TaxID=1965325 RepID=UPI003AA8CB33
MKKKYAIKDIAAALNVSVTTVSFVLNGKAKEKRISDEVAKKVKNFADSVNYRPNLLAQSLRTGKSRIIVVMLEDISNPFFAKLARILEDLAFQKNYKVFFCSNENKDERAIDLIKTFRERRVDGYMIVPSPGIENDIKSFLEEEIPIILFDRDFPDLKINYVGIDNEDSVYRATQHLYEKNYKQIAFITINSPQSQMKNRFLGYKKAVINNEKKLLTLEIPYPDTIQEESNNYIAKFLSDNPQIDAIIFATNYLSIAGLKVIKEMESNGCKKQLGIITFDDDELFQIYTPTISVIHQPLQEMAEAMMNLMFDVLDSEKGKHSIKRRILKTKFIERESTAFKK